ncbi:hypothetical protein [Azospirillum sp. SYSU D00513]|nr:hypothetical protein [Azospirillum sp. SYSU D00513]
MGDLVPVKVAVEGTVLEVVGPTIPEEDLTFASICFAMAAS